MTAERFKRSDSQEGYNPVEGRAGRKGPKNSREVYLEGREKSFEGYLRCPYRKPTQVDRKRILRPTGEG